MKDKNWIIDKLTISKKEITVKIGEIEQQKLKFYPDNPRIHSLITAANEELSQGEIESQLSKKDHVKRLIQSIKVNGGLTDPLIVRDKDYVVLEGNSRLAAYRVLARNDPIKWGVVKVKLLPADISEDIVFALLGEYHIIGRKDWAPYEQAGYIWRRHSQHNLPPGTIATEMGLPTKEVSHLIEVYKFMLKHKDCDISHWSYYEELLSSNHVRKVLEHHKEFEKVIVSKIQSGEVIKAVDVRDKIVAICKARGDSLKIFLSNRGSLEDAYKLAAEGQNIWLNILTRFRKKISEPEVVKQITSSDYEYLKKCIFEIQKIRESLDKLWKKIANED